MTIEERIARLETRADATEKWLESIDAKVDHLIALANRGRGAWGTILWLGGALAGLAAIGATIATWRHP